MANWLAAGIGGAAKGGAQYTEKLINENMQKRRDERLAKIRRGETREARTHEKGLLEESRGYEEAQSKKAKAQSAREAARGAAIKETEKKTAHERGLLETTHKTDEEIRKAKELSKAGITSTGKKASGAATNAYKKYNEMLGLGKDKDTAFALAYSSIKTLKDEYGGDEQLVDLATNKLVGMIKEDEETGKKSYVPTLGAAQKNYNTKEEVRAAYRAGDLTREEAKKLISGM